MNYLFPITSILKSLVISLIFLTSGCCPCLQRFQDDSAKTCPDTCITNATIYGLEAQPVTLENGRWEGAPFVADGASRPSIFLDSSFHAYGDMDGDGRQEYAVILYENQGGSGGFCHIVILKEENGSCESVATAPLGDRVKVEGGDVEDGLLVLKIMVHAPADPMCCPSRPVVKRWRLTQGRLEMLE